MKKIILLVVVFLCFLSATATAQTTITLSAAGDVILGGDPKIKSALGQSSLSFFTQLIERYGTTYPFSNVSGYFRNDDVSIVNLECTLTNGGKSKPKSHSFRGSPGYASMLADAGIEVCNLANNHTRDFGTAGLRSTAAALNRANVRWSNFSSNGTYTVKKDGMSVKIGFAGFQTPTSLSKMQKRVKALAKRCDVVVTSFHWCDTQEWTQRNYPSDQRMARAAIAAGADLVLGHHRHVPAGIETYRDKYIVYDLGNFVVGIKHLADSAGRPFTDSMIFQWTFTVNENKQIGAQSIRVIPCTTSTTGEKYPVTDGFGTAGAPINNFRPAVLSGTQGEALLARIRALSTVEIPG
ncbi:MAG: CapA family protein [Clostridia bacterium]